MVLLLVGCNDYSTTLNSTDKIDCYIDCKEKIKNTWCSEGVSMFDEELHNRKIINYSCACIMEGCLK